VAVFEGEEVKVLSREDADASDHPALLRSLLAPESAGDDSADVLIRLAVSMRAHKRGGHAARRARGDGGLAGVDRPARGLRRRSRVHGAARPRPRGHGRGSPPRPRSAGARRGRGRGPDRRGRRDRHLGSLRVLGSA
jgi:ribosomal protein L4